MTESEEDHSTFSPTTHTTLEAIRRLRVVELRSALVSRGLSSTGKKEELVVRLWEWMQAEEALREDEASTGDSAAAPLSGSKKTDTDENGAVSFNNDTNVAEKNKTSKGQSEKVAINAVSNNGGGSDGSLFADKKEVPQSSLSSSSSGDADISVDSLRLKERAARFGVTPASLSSSTSALLATSLSNDSSFNNNSNNRRGSRDYDSATASVKMGQSSDAISAVQLDEAELERMRKRQARFGCTTSKLLEQAEAQAAFHKRQERFEAHQHP